MIALTEFENFVLSEILRSTPDKEEFNLYDQIRSFIVHKDISHFPENLVLETCEHIGQFITDSGLFKELQEKRLYSLTEKGVQAITAGIIVTSDVPVPFERTGASGLY